MQRVTLSATVFSLALSTCSSMPEKPVVAMALIDVPAQIAREGLSGQGDINPVPLLEYDSASCFKPKAWEKVLVYIKLLELHAKEMERKLERCK